MADNENKLYINVDGVKHEAKGGFAFNITKPPEEFRILGTTFIKDDFQTVEPYEKTVKLNPHVFKMMCEALLGHYKNNLIKVDKK